MAAKSPAPATAEAAVVSLAGKLDSLAGCFAAGMIPTGSADPYALRRQALGLIRIVLEKQLPLDLDEAIARALALQPVAAPEPAKLAAHGSLYLTRPTLGNYIQTRGELIQRADDLFGWVAAGKLTVRVGAEYPLRDAAEAHRALEGRRTTGKVLLIP